LAGDLGADVLDAGGGADGEAPERPAECAEGEREEAPCAGGGVEVRVCSGAGVFGAWYGCPGSCPDEPPTVAHAEGQVGDILELSVLAFEPFAPRPAPPYYWRLLGRPEGAAAGLFERFFDARHPDHGGSADDPATPFVLFFGDRAGAYVVELMTDGPSARRCTMPATRLVITLTP
jgi:hypothetical protein